MTTTIRPDDLRASLENGLGALCYWELSETAITPNYLRGLLSSLGEDASIVPDIDPASAASRAAREFGLGRGSETRYKAEVVEKTGDRIEIGLLERQRVSNNEVRWVQIDRVIGEIDTTSPTPSFAGIYSVHGSEQSKSLIELVRSRAEHLDADWIRPSLIQARLDAMGSLNVRRQGGVVFVSRTYAEELSRLARIVRSIGASSFDIVSVSATEESRASIHKAANAHFDEQLTELVAKLDAWTEKARAPRSDAVANLIEQVGDLVLRGDLYSSVLEVAMDDVKARLNVVRQRAAHLLMNGVEDAAA